jgi:hypothetical protein
MTTGTVLSVSFSKLTGRTVPVAIQIAKTVQILKLYCFCSPKRNKFSRCLLKIDNFMSFHDWYSQLDMAKRPKTSFSSFYFFAK